ncbi:MAG: DUF5320 domain-containing protein [Candidatus Thermoplasmatota archaeon]|nr:DUF5320 domain-containing protein [Candidatus Thermoplasmatota archaeon]
MPAGDKTGPEGRGPRTGRGLGYCAGYDTPGFTKGAPRGGGGYGRGRGYGRGFGRGRRWRYHPPMPYPEPYYHPGYQPAPYYPPEGTEPAEQTETERTYLQDAIRHLEEELTVLRERIDQLSDK